MSGNVDLHDHTGWYGFDLDGTIAKYDHWRGPGHIGEPIMPMVNLIKKMLAEGKKIKIFTARAYFPQYDERRQKEVMVARIALREWRLEHIGQELEMTNTKDFSMLGLFDDRAIQVEFNTGRIIGA